MTFTGNVLTKRRVNEKDFDEVPLKRLEKKARCNNSCLSGYGPSSNNHKGNDGKCVYCNHKK